MPSANDENKTSKISDFVKRANETLEVVDFRKITTSLEFEDVQKLRFDAYSRENNVFSDKAMLRTDKFDNEKNTEIFGLYINRRIASSVRLHRVTVDTPQTPSATYFPEFFMTRLARGDSFLEATRFCASAEFTTKYPSLHFMTMRVVFMAAIYYDLPFILCSVRAEHSAFYRRYYGFEAQAIGKIVPTISVPANLYMGDVEKNRPMVEGRLPFMQSTDDQRKELFEGAFEQPRLRVVGGR